MCLALAAAGASRIARSDASGFPEPGTRFDTEIAVSDWCPQGRVSVDGHVWTGYVDSPLVGSTIGTTVSSQGENFRRLRGTLVVQSEREAQFTADGGSSSVVLSSEAGMVAIACARP